MMRIIETLLLKGKPDYSFIARKPALPATPWPFPPARVPADLSRLRVRGRSLVRILRMMMRLGRVLVRLHRVLVGGLVIALGMVFRCGVVGLRCVLMMLCCLLVCFVCHKSPR